jgi:hypothetical protein
MRYFTVDGSPFVLAEDLAWEPHQLMVDGNTTLRRIRSAVCSIRLERFATKAQLMVFSQGTPLGRLLLRLAGTDLEG